MGGAASLGRAAEIRGKSNENPICTHPVKCSTSVVYSCSCALVVINNTALTIPRYMLPHLFAPAPAGGTTGPRHAGGCGGGGDDAAHDQAPEGVSVPARRHPFLADPRKNELHCQPWNRGLNPPPPAPRSPRRCGNGIWRTPRPSLPPPPGFRCRVCRRPHCSHCYRPQYIFKRRAVPTGGRHARGVLGAGARTVSRCTRLSFPYIDPWKQRVASGRYDHTSTAGQVRLKLAEKQQELDAARQQPPPPVTLAAPADGGRADAKIRRLQQQVHAPCDKAGPVFM